MTRALWALAALAAWTAAAPAQGWAEKMFPKGLTHDFGTRPRGAQMSFDFPITNPYAVPMEITEIKSGCGCVSASAASTTLPPKGSTLIRVNMDGTRFTGPKEVGVRVTVGPRFVSSAELKVKANMRTDVVFNPGAVNFGNVAAGQTPVQTVDVEYAGPLDWKVTEVVARDVPYTVAMNETFRRPGQVGYRLTVTLKKDAPVGLLKHDLTLRTNDPAGPTVEVPVMATVQSGLAVNPANLAIGVNKPGEVLTRRVAVTGTSAFTVTGVSAAGGGVTLGAPLKKEADVRQFVTLKIEVGPAGAFQRKVLIQTTAQAAPLELDVDGLSSN